MRRRTVLSGLGATAVGAGVVFGSGAFSTIRADRVATVSVANEDEALLAMEPHPDSPNSGYATQGDSNNQIGLEFTDDENSDSPGALNQNATATFDDVFRITNQGTQAIELSAIVKKVGEHDGIDSFELYDTESGDQFSAESSENVGSVGLNPGDSVDVGVRIETSRTRADETITIVITTSPGEIPPDEGDEEEEEPATHPESQFPQALTDPRARRAANAWERGYRGRADRSLAITDSGIDARHADLGPWNGVRVSNDEGGSDLSIEEGANSFDDITLPGANEVPELVAWHQDGSANSTNSNRPRDTNGHGTHVASIMTGTGRGKALDPTDIAASWEFSSEDGTPNKPVEKGNAITREFTVPADRNDATLFCAAKGQWITVTLEDPGGNVIASDSTAQNAIENTAVPLVWNDTNAERAVIEAGATHDPANFGDGENPTYTLRVEQNYTLRGEGQNIVPPEEITTHEIRVMGVAELVQKGTDLAADGVAGNPETVPVPGDLIPEGGRTRHPGVAPGNSLVGVAGLSGALRGVGGSPGRYAEAFNLRAVNMSWGTVGGLPVNLIEGAVFTYTEEVAALAENGIVTVAAAGNAPGTPVSGSQSGPGAGGEAISTVWTGRLDGIAVQSSGGLGVVDEDNELIFKPDVCAYGNNELAAEANTSNTKPGDYGEEDGYTTKSGTSMASPSVCGLVGLVTQAMEEDGPAGLDIPEPSAMTSEDVDGLDWTVKTKQAILATASTTAFNALPWHGDQAPAYTPGQRDPYEGFGRANYGAAVDAVSRDLTGRTVSETLGLNVPDDEQAVAGYITGSGEITVSTTFDSYEGGDADLTNGTPHIDLFVYDALNPDPETGSPNVVTSALGVDSPDNEVTVSLGKDDVYYVVAKLVRVPGDSTEQLPPSALEAIPNEVGGFLFNGLDVRVNMTLNVE